MVERVTVTVVESSASISTLAEAVAYYHAKLAGVRRVTCYDQRIDIVFPRDYIHLYTETGGCGPEVTHEFAPGRFDTRNFSLARARLMDRVLPAISSFTLSIEGQGAKGRENKVLHGPKLVESGEYMRVVLRPGPKAAWTCVSAYPVDAATYWQAYRSKRAKFPPK